MLNFKRALIIGTMLTALSAQAFAAPAVENAPAPTMKERVNAILNEDNTVCPAKDNKQCPQPGMRHHKNLKLTPEQRKVVDKYRGQWKDMTPEQRKAAGQEIFTVMTKDMTPEQKQAFIENMKQRHKEMMERQARHDQRAKETMAKLTPEQRVEVENFLKEDMAARQARHEKMQQMTPEQRAAIRANTPKKYNHGHKKHHKQEMRAQKQAQEVTATKVA